MNMRDLIDIVESKGDSKLPLDTLASKYLGAGTKWSDTHYKNILYRIQPPSEMLRLALRLDGGESGPVTQQMIDDFTTGPESSGTQNITSAAFEILGFDMESYSPVPPMTQDYYWAMASALASEVYGDDSAGDSHYIIDTGPKTALMYTTASDDPYFSQWFALGDVNPSLEWLKKFRADYTRRNPIQ
jgi:hypothetical protein